MESKRLTPNKNKTLPYNYSLYPIEEMTEEKLSERKDMSPIEYCEVYNATIFVKPPYKKIIEF